MFDHNTILSFGFYKYGKPFTGSFQGNRYRIMAVLRETHESDALTEENAVLRLWLWPEPLSFEKTDPQLMTTVDFPFSEAGYEQVIAYLNEHLVDKK